MAVNSAETLSGIRNQQGAADPTALNSDFYLVIDGFESIAIRCNQAPWAVLTPGEPVEVPGPMGTKTQIPSQVNTAQSGAIAFTETTTGQIDNALIAMLLNGGTWNATIYEGDEDKNTRGKVYENCYINCEPIDRMWENRTSPLTVSGTLYYHYYGEIVEGNADTLDG